MSVVIPNLRAVVSPAGWVRSALWRNARAVPSLDLRFADNKSLVDAVTGASLITFTRASSGTFVGSDGLIATAATDVPRFDHNPTTGESLGLLVEEQRTNLLTYSELFNASPWAPGSLSVTPTTETTSPAGNSTAARFIEDTVAAQFHFINYPLTKAASAIQYTVCAYAKDRGRELIFSAANGTTGAVARFNLATGVITAPATGYGGGFTAQGSTITSAGNGWYRCSMTFTTDATTGLIIQYALYNTALATNVYTGDGASGVFLWGAQLEVGAFPTSYIPTLPAFVSRASSATFFNSAGVLQTAGSGVPRSNAFLPDSNGVFRPIGLLLEEARTNLLLRSEEFNDASWPRSGTTIPTITANTGIAPDGNTTADLWTRSITGSNFISQAVAKSASAIQYTFSIFVRQSVGNFCALRCQGTFPNKVDVVFDINSGTISSAATVAGGTFTGPFASITPYPNGWYRLTVTATSDTATFYQCIVSFSSNGAVIDGIDSVSNSAGLLWGAQLEAGAFPTSYILTTTAAATRAADVSTSAAATRSADVASITGTAFSGWYRQDEGTVFAEGRPVNGGVVTVADDGSFSNRKPQINLGAAGSADIAYVAAGSVVASFVQASSASVMNRWATAYAADNFGFAANGSAPVQDSSGVLPSGNNALRLGTFHSGSSYANGPIKRICFWPQRLANSTLQGITS